MAPSVQVCTVERQSFNFENAYMADVLRHRIKTVLNRDSPPPPGFYYFPQYNQREREIDGRLDSGIIKISYSYEAPPAPRHAQPATNLVFRDSSLDFMRPHGGIRAAPAPGTAQSSYQPRRRPEQNISPLSWMHTSRRASPELYTVAMDTSSWDSPPGTFVSPPNLDAVKQAIRLGVDTGSTTTWALSQRFQKLDVDSNGSLVCHSWTPEEKQRIGHHHVLNLSVNALDSKGKSPGGRTVNPVDHGPPGANFKYGDGSHLAISHFETTLRIYTLPRSDRETFHVMTVPNFCIGAGYAVNSIFARFSHDGNLGLGRSTLPPHPSMSTPPSIVELLKVDGVIPDRSVYIRFHPNPSPSNRLYSFVAFGGWPSQLTSSTPRWTTFDVVPNNDTWSVHLVKIVLTESRSRVSRSVDVNLDVLLDTGSSLSYFPESVYKGLRSAINPSVSKKDPINVPIDVPYNIDTFEVALYFRLRHDDPDTHPIHVHPSRFLRIPDQYALPWTGNCPIRAEDDPQRHRAILGINFFQSAFVGFHWGDLRPDFVKMAPFLFDPGTFNDITFISRRA